MSKFFFAKDYSLTEAAFSGAIVYALMRGNYGIAFALYVLCVFVSVVGTLRFEKLEGGA